MFFKKVFLKSEIINGSELIFKNDDERYFTSQLIIYETFFYFKLNTYNSSFLD